MPCPVTDEQLAVWTAGDAPALDAHVAQCPACQRRAAALRALDQQLSALVTAPVPPEALDRAAAALRRELFPPPQILTLDEVATFLRLTPDELGPIVEDLPAFELAGQLRVRRDRLLDWIAQRERTYTRARAQSATARIRLAI